MTHPELDKRIEALIVRMKELGYNIVKTSGYRSFKEQDALYAQGRTKPGKIVTYAVAGSSYHNYGLAQDVAFLVNGKVSWDEKMPWNLLGKEGKLFGLEWGGDWKGKKRDRPHFQYTKGFTTGQLLQIYKKYNLKKVWEVVC